MAAWFTIYCSRSVDHLTAAEILSGIDGCDFRTTAEGYGIEDDEAVDRSLAHLTLEPVAATGGVRFGLTYGPSTRRPILIHVWTDPEVVEEELDESDELLDRLSGNSAGQIRSHLDRVVEIVAVELGWSQLEDMGVVFAGAISEYLASVGNGLIRDPYDVWWAVEDHVPIRIAKPE